MQRLDPSLWNLASVAARAMPLGIMIAACGPVVGVVGETDTDVDPTHPTDPTDPSDPSDPSDPTGNDTMFVPQCDAYNPCAYNYDCVNGYCQPRYDCPGGCCYYGEGGCCYGDDGCNYDYCYYDTDCAPGEVCSEYGGCNPAIVLPECGVPVFAQAIPIDVGGSPLSLAFVDGNADGPRELAIGSTDGAIVVPGANAGAGAPLATPLGSQVDHVAAGDLDADGDEDLLVSTSGAASGFAAFYNDGVGAFGLGVGPTGVSTQFELADIDADGLVDVVGRFDLGAPQLQLAILRSLGMGVYDPPYIHEPSNPSLDFATAPLFKRTVGEDLVALDSGTLSIWNPGPLDGTVDMTLWFGGFAPGSVAVGDVDGDSSLDIVHAMYFNGGTMVRYFLRNGASYTPQSPVYVADEFERIHVGDFDGDGAADVVLLGGGAAESGGFVVLQSGGPFGTSCQSYFDGGSSTVGAVGDFTGDGVIDLAHAEGGIVYVRTL